MEDIKTIKVKIKSSSTIMYVKQKCFCKIICVLWVKLISVISLIVLHLHTIKALSTQIALQSKKHSESRVIWRLWLLQTSSGALGRTTRGVAATYGLTQAALLNGPDQWRQSVFTEDLGRLRSSSLHNGLTLPELTHLPKSSSDQNLLRFLFFFWIQWNMRWAQPQQSSLCVWQLWNC